MQKYKEINGNDYVKNSRTTINETMQSIQSMNSGTAFPTNNLFEGMKCYRTDLKKTYTLTDVENNTWVEDAHATLSDEAMHAASATKLQTARSLNLGGAVTADAATFDGTEDATINVNTLDATKLKGTASVSTTGNAATASKLATPRALSLTGKAAGSTTFDGSANASINVTSVNADTATKLSTARKINITGNASGSGTFDGSGDISISTTVNESKHAAAADMATNDSNGDKIDDTYLKKATVIDVIYPIGSIYMSMSATNPADLFGVGTWKRISQGRMLLGADDSTYKAGATGGEATHTLTAAEMPAHSHTGTTSTNGAHSHSIPKLYYVDDDEEEARIRLTYRGRTNELNTSTNGNHNHTFTTDNSGGGAAHNNMPPYLVCYIWQRTA